MIIAKNTYKQNGINQVGICCFFREWSNDREHIETCSHFVAVKF